MADRQRYLARALRRVRGWADGATARRARTRLSGRQSGGDDGFVLLESVVSIGLITVMMGALTTLFITTGQTTAHLRARQQAIQLADSAIEQVHAFAPSSLKSGRDAQSVATQYTNGTSTPGTLATMLATMTPVSDPNATAGAGNLASTPAVAPAVCPTSAVAPAALHLPTSPVCQAVGTRPFSINYYLGRCYVATNATLCTSTPPASPATYLTYLRAVIAVTWTNDHCSTPTCFYVTNTLIDDSPDPRFDIPHTGPPPPSISVSDRTSNVADTVPFAGPTLQSGGTAPFSWSATGLPPGLTMASDGTITGTIADQAATSVAYPVSVTVVDGMIQQGVASFVWTVVRPTITAPPDQNTPINTPVNLQVVSTCNSTPCTYSMTNGPIGLTINNSGLISGSPTVAATVTVTVTVKDSHGVTATSAPFNWAVLIPATVCVPAIALANGSFEAPVVSHGAPNWLVGGTSPLLWNTTEPDNVIELWKNDGSGSQASISAQSANGGMPITAEDGSQWAELNANSVGALYQDLTTVSGQVLQWSVWHRGRYSGAANANKKDVMQVQIGSRTVQTSQIPTGQTTKDISDGPNAWVLYRGIYIVPAGQTITRFQFAAISTASGDQSVGNFIDNLSLNNYVACLDNAPTDQTSTVNTAISPLQLSASRGSGSFTWGGGNSLPAGLSISPDGLITGTPSTPGTSSVVLTLTDNQTTFEQSVSFNWTVVAAPSVLAPNSQRTSVGGTVNLALTTSCLNLPCSYAMDNGPSGLTVSNTGVVTGTVTSAPQTFNSVTITVRDNQGVTATTAPFVWAVNPAPALSSPGNQKTLRGAAVGLSMAPFASGGFGTYSYTASGLPGWLTINSSSGVISGTAPTSADSVTSGIRISLTDGTGAIATSPAFSWTVYAAPTVTSPGNQASSVGTVVGFALTTTCPNSPCSYAFNNKVPSGLSISSSGAVTGTISAAVGSYPGVIVTVTDAGGAASVSASFTWTVNPAPKILNPGNQSVRRGAAVSLDMSAYASGGTGSYTYTAAGLPSWLAINSGSGKITGTSPNSANSVTSGITVTLTDSTGASSVSTAFSWTVNNTLSITVPNQTSYKLSAINVDLDTFTTGATSPYTYTATGLPSWVSLNPVTGVLSGTAPSVAANTTTKTTGITVTATDRLGVVKTSAAFNWYLTDLIWTGSAANGSTISTVRGTSLTGTSATSYVTGGSGTRVYTATSLPTGVSLAANGAFSGTANTAGSWQTVLSVTDSVGATSNSLITWNVN